MEQVPRARKKYSALWCGLRHSFKLSKGSKRRKAEQSISGRRGRRCSHLFTGRWETGMGILGGDITTLFKVFGLACEEVAMISIGAVCVCVCGCVYGIRMADMGR